MVSMLVSKEATVNGKGLSQICFNYDKLLYAGHMLSHKNIFCYIFHVAVVAVGCRGVTDSSATMN